MRTSEIITCPKGHVMDAMTFENLVKSYPAYINGGNCDKCGKSLSGNLVHCAICNYDICFSCIMHPPHEQTMRWNPYVGRDASINETCYKAVAKSDWGKPFAFEPSRPPTNPPFGLHRSIPEIPQPSQQSPYLDDAAQFYSDISTPYVKKRTIIGEHPIFFKDMSRSPYFKDDGMHFG